MKKIILLSLSAFFISGCALKSEKVRIPTQENISEKDIEIYQDLKSASCSIQRLKDGAAKDLKNTFNRLEANQNMYAEKLDNGEDRFSKILNSYKKEKHEN